MPAVAARPFAKMRTDAFVLQGGLDEVTPNLELKAGVCRQASNFEAAVTGGYARIGGYERYDGRARPSDATYTLVQLTLVTAPTVGQTLTGLTSGATGQILAVASSYLVLTLVTGTFATAEVVKVGATVIGTTVPTMLTVSSQLNARYLSLAADAYRALIGSVPGSGAIRGVVSANLAGVHKVFACRDNVGATACVLYQATGSGWTAVTLYNEVSFTAGGTSQPAEGATLTQGGNTATIKRVVFESGSWSGTTAAGRFIVTTPTPGNFAAGAATIGGITVTLSGVQTAITFAAGGKFEFDVGNFAGQLATSRIYGADGVNRGFEFDGTVLAPISTGAAVDTPKHVKIHRNALVLTIGSSLMISGPGLPYHFNATDGGAEIATGDTVTGVMVLPGVQGSATLGVDARNSTYMLYGDAAGGSNPWQLVPFNNGVGGLDYTQQTIVDGYKLDDRGVTNLTSAKEYGNFVTGTLTFGLQNYITSKRGLVTCSAVHRTKSQYRLFFSDGSGLFLTLVNGTGTYATQLNSKVVGAMPINYANPLNCVWNGETAAGEEVTYAGSLSGGYVYQLDRGSSCDGQTLDASITLAYHFLKSPRIYKRFYRASVEIQSNFYAALQFGYVLGYGSADLAQGTPQPYSSNFSAVPTWDNISWDAFTWDGRTLSPTEVELGGTGENIQYTLTATGTDLYPFTVNSLITTYALRRAIR